MGTRSIIVEVKSGVAECTYQTKGTTLYIIDHDEHSVETLVDESEGFLDKKPKEYISDLIATWRKETGL